ncbi:14-3-3 protein epsilon-like [Drosophila obscura]|uniref:14-3-3 protein epsilon-like n=1 Tax=Drosophila obscura TaxID=7282 RepID=UPI001BB1CD20|nr:14-3-3 protein epsilon-like [Drosophila obscura]
MSERQNNFFKAKLADQADRHTDMAEAMKSTVLMGEVLTVEERNLFSAAYKNRIGKVRYSCRVLNSIERKETGVVSVEHLGVIRKYREDLEEELADICMTVLNLINTHLLSNVPDNEGKVFYYKMRGDYFRYLAEFTIGADFKQASEQSLCSYNRAWELATELAPTHPIRLGLALNLSVFYYEIMHFTEKAIDLAKPAFDDAIAELDKLNEESYRDSTLIMQLLRDNLSLLTSALQQETAQEDNTEDGGEPENQTKEGDLDEMDKY